MQCIYFIEYYILSLSQYLHVHLFFSLPTYIYFFGSPFSFEEEQIFDRDHSAEFTIMEVRAVI